MGAIGWFAELHPVWQAPLATGLTQLLTALDVALG
jgi:hypothetical protein